MSNKVSQNRRRAMCGSSMSSLISPEAPTYTKDHIRINKQRLKSMSVVSASAAHSRSTSHSSLLLVSTPTPPVSQILKTQQQTQLPKSVPRPTKDFIKLNKIKSSSSSNNTSSTVIQPRKLAVHAPGKIPRYLADLRDSLARTEQARVVSMATSHIPPGMRVMGDIEREDAIRALELRRASLERSLMKFPIVVETHRHRQALLGIEVEMKEIDEGIEVLGRRIVYIVDDGDDDDDSNKEN